MLLAMPVAFIAVAFVYPVVTTLVLSVTDPAPGFANYRALLSDPTVLAVLSKTLRIGAVTTVATLVLAYLLALRLLHGGMMARLTLGTVLTSFWISGLVRALAWLTILSPRGPLSETGFSLGLLSERTGFGRNETAVVVGMVHYMLPYGTLLLTAQMRTIAPDLSLAARGLGAGRTATFFRVFFPLSIPGVIAAVILVGILSLGFYITPALLGGGKVILLSEFITIQVLDLLRWGLAAALATVLLTATVILVAVLARFGDPGAVQGR